MLSAGGAGTHSGCVSRKGPEAGAARGPAAAVCRFTLAPPPAETGEAAGLPRVRRGCETGRVATPLSATGTLDVLLVEDNPGDALLVAELFAESPRTRLFDVVSDGLAAMLYLRRKAPFADAMRPNLVLLDLNLPGLHGLELLSLLRGEPALARVPVVVLSSSDAPADVGTAYERHASCYVQKPADLDGLRAAVRDILGFWGERVALPPR